MLPPSPRTCKVCEAPLTGRADQVFCSVACKNRYHVHLRRSTDFAVRETDKILHRNRAILLELLGKNATQKKVRRLDLEKKKFHFSYLTRYYRDRRGKIYHFVYDFAWIESAHQEVLIIRKGRGKQKSDTTDPGHP